MIIIEYSCIYCNEIKDSTKIFTIEILEYYETERVIERESDYIEKYKKNNIKLFNFKDPSHHYKNS